MPKTLPSTVVQIIEDLNARLGITPQHTAGRPEQIEVNDDGAVILRTILAVIAEIPDQLLQVKAEQRTQMLAAIEDLKQVVGKLKSRSRPTTVRREIQRMTTMAWLDRTPIPKDSRFATEVIRDVLKNCPDEAIKPATLDLPFITDPVLRESLRLDISSVDAALENGEYKSATVLGGSIVEALLLWSLSRKTESERTAYINSARSGGQLKSMPDNDLNRWDLHEFIEVCLAGSLIGEKTAAIARIAKHFRNLIHPGRALRLTMECNRGTAFASASAMEHVAADLRALAP